MGNGVPGGRGPNYLRERPGEPPPRALARKAGRRRGGFFRLLRIGLGFILLFLGFIGLFLPVLQGVLMILGGLALLSRDLPWARSVTDRVAAFVRRRSDARKRRASDPAA